MLSEEQVRHIAKLARITLTDAEVKKFSGQLSGILDYMDILNEIDTKNVEPTLQVTGLKNVTRADEVKEFGDSDGLLGCSSLEIKNNQIKVKSVIK